MSGYACWKDGSVEAALNLPPLHPDTDWCFDQAASCRAYPANDPDGWPADCFGCVRKLRAVGQASGTMAEHSRRIGRRVSPVDAVSRLLDESVTASDGSSATTHAEASESASGGEIFTSEVAA